MIAGLYAIIDVPHVHGLSPAEATTAVLGDRLDGGVDGACAVQLRAKQATTAERVDIARAMLEPCRRAGVPLFVDDDLAAALQAGADGVHLGQGDPGFDDVAGVRREAKGAGSPDLRVGISTHDLGQLRAAGRTQPDYLAFGPVAITRSKANPDPIVGIEGLADACRVASRPLVAIGGLNAALCEAAIEVGAACVAVIGALCRPSIDATRTAAIELARRVRAAAEPLGIDEVHARIPVLSRTLLHDLAQWGDSLGVQIELGLPARFGPRIVDGRALYRPSDVCDLAAALGKRNGETWAQWHAREVEDTPALVQLRRREH